jgi:hypothetical protein
MAGDTLKAKRQRPFKLLGARCKLNFLSVSPSIGAADDPVNRFMI